MHSSEDGGAFFVRRIEVFTLLQHYPQFPLLASHFTVLRVSLNVSKIDQSLQGPGTQLLSFGSRAVTPTTSGDPAALFEGSLFPSKRKASSLLRDSIAIDVQSLQSHSCGQLTTQADTPSSTGCTTLYCSLQDM